MRCVKEGDCISGVALAICHKLGGISSVRLSGHMGTLPMFSVTMYVSIKYLYRVPTPPGKSWIFL